MPALTETVPIAWSSAAATIAVVAAGASAIALLALHFLSPEFEPSWRMVSEYANGRHAWMLTVVFVAWGVASWALSVALVPMLATWLGRIGLVFLVLAGVGQIMGGLFDVNHRLHGAAFAIGVPSMTVAAILITIVLRRTGFDIATWPMHLYWISFVLMAVSMALFMRALSRAGIEPTSVLERLPDGMTAYNGWANRLLSQRPFCG